MNGATKDDLVNDCRGSFRDIGKAVGYGDTKPESEWLEKLNKVQLEKLSTFLDYVWDELRPPC